MARKDLLKKAFRNNFIRKSVADLRSLTTDKASSKSQQSSPSSLRFKHHDAAPVLPTPRTSTPDFPAHETAMMKEESSDTGASSERLPVGQDPREVAHCVNSVKPGESVRISTPELRHHEERVLEVGGNAMTMSSSQVRLVMEQVCPPSLISKRWQGS